MPDGLHVPVNDVGFRKAVYAQLDKQPFFKIQFVKRSGWASQCPFDAGAAQVVVQVNYPVEFFPAELWQHWCKALFKGVNSVQIWICCKDLGKLLFGKKMQFRIQLLLQAPDDRGG